MGTYGSASAGENEMELKLELRRITQGQWFLNKFYEHAELGSVTSIYPGMLRRDATQATIWSVLKSLCLAPIDLHFVNAYLGTEAEPTGVTSQEDGSVTPTP